MSKRIKHPAVAVSNTLNNEELAYIAKFVMANKYPCESADALFTKFAKPGMWRVLAETLGWRDIDSRKKFYERCVKERQNHMAAEYDQYKVLSRNEIQANIASRWIETNDWVVPGLQVLNSSDSSDYGDSHLSFLKIKPKGKIQVHIESMDGQGLPAPAKVGVAMYETGPRGTRYAVKIKGGRYLPLTSVPL